MNPFVDGKWPEQELILEWMRRYDVPIVFSKRNALMETLTAIRVERDKELADLRQRAEQAGAERDYYRKAIQDFQDGNYAHPRAFRSKDVGHGVGKCCHGTWYWEECESCNSEHFDNALTNGPAAQSTIAELRRQVEMIDKERIELAKMLLHYVRTVPLGNQPHMSAEIAEKMALVALEKTRS